MPTEPIRPTGSVPGHPESQEGAFPSKCGPFRLSGANGAFLCPDGAHVVGHAKAIVHSDVDVIVYDEGKTLLATFAENHPDCASQAVAALEAREDAQGQADGEREPSPDLPADPLPDQPDRRTETITPTTPSAAQACGSGTTKQGSGPGVPGSSAIDQCSETATHGRRDCLEIDTSVRKSTHSAGEARMGDRMRSNRERVLENGDGRVRWGNIQEALTDSLENVLAIAEGQDEWRDISEPAPGPKPGEAAVEATRKLRVEVEQLRARCNGVEEKLRIARAARDTAVDAAKEPLSKIASLEAELLREKRARQSDLAKAEDERMRLAEQAADYPRLLAANRELLEKLQGKASATRNALLLAELIHGNEQIVEACADKTAPIESLAPEHPSRAAHEAVKALKIRYNKALDVAADWAWAVGMVVGICEGERGWWNVAEPKDRPGVSAIRAAKELRRRLEETDRVRGEVVARLEQVGRERDDMNARLASVGSSTQSFEVDVKVSPETEARLKHEFVSKLAGELHVVRIRNGGWTSPDESLREAEAIWEDSKQRPKALVRVDGNVEKAEVPRG